MPQQAPIMRRNTESYFDDYYHAKRQGLAVYFYVVDIAPERFRHDEHWPFSFLFDAVGAVSSRFQEYLFSLVPRVAFPVYYFSKIRCLRAYLDTAFTSFRQYDAWVSWYTRRRWASFSFRPRCDYELPDITFFRRASPREESTHALFIRVIISFSSTYMLKNDERLCLGLTAHHHSCYLRHASHHAMRMKEAIRFQNKPGAAMRISHATILNIDMSANTPHARQMCQAVATSMPPHWSQHAICAEAASHSIFTLSHGHMTLRFNRPRLSHSHGIIKIKIIALLLEMISRELLWLWMPPYMLVIIISLFPFEPLSHGFWYFMMIIDKSWAAFDIINNNRAIYIRRHCLLPHYFMLHTTNAASRPYVLISASRYRC